MRKAGARMSVSVATFFLGVLGVYFYDSVLRVPSPRTLDEIANLSNRAVTQSKPTNFDPFQMPEGANPLKKGEFFNVGHACGNGYVDGYLAYDGSRMSAGLNILTPDEFKKVVEGYEQIIQRNDSFRNKEVKKGIRIVQRGHNRETGKEFFEVIIYDRKKDMYYIAGPTLEITLELERWLDSHS
jgi:hypothetical protein